MSESPSYDIIWQFEINGGQQADFEAAYGSAGEWAQLFARADGYLETRLLADDERPDVYVTIDRWRTRQDFQNFKALFAEDYLALDRKLEGLARVERRIGAFNSSGMSNIV